MTLLTPVAAHADADTMDFLAPTPTGNTIYDSWTPDNTNYYFCGDGGTILHYDGSTFTEMSTPTQYALNGIHGTANNDIWAVGGNAYSEFTDSTRSVILHYDGNSWSSVTPPSTSFGEYHVFDDVWVQGTTIYAVSETYSSIARKVGSQAWAFIDVGTTTNFGYNGLYGFASNDIYAVGECGMINHWNGTTWTLENEESENLCSSSMMSTVLLYSVWGPDADNVFVTGNSGQLLKRADGGGSWNTLYAGGSWSSDSSKHGLSGSSANEVYLAGLNGDLDYWNGSSMTALGEFLSDNSQYTMVRNGSGNYYIGMSYGKISTLDGSTRTALTTLPPTTSDMRYTQRDETIWACPSDLHETTPIIQWDGKTTVEHLPGVNGTIRITVFRVHSENDIFVGGYGLGVDEQFFRYDGTNWTADTTYPIFTIILDEIKSGATTAYIRQDGNWDSDMDSYLGTACVGDTCTATAMYYKLGTGSDGKIYAVGKSGSIAYYANGSWSTESSSTTNDLWAVAGGGGQVCAAGEARTIVCKNEGGSWASVSGLTEKTENTFFGIAHAGGTDFVAVLNTGNATWNPMDTGYTGANKGTFYKVSNKTASLLRTGLSAEFGGIDSDSNGNLAAFGTGGVIFGNAITPSLGSVNLVPVRMLLLD